MDVIAGRSTCRFLDGCGGPMVVGEVNFQTSLSELITRSLRRGERSFVECSAVATGGRATAFLRVVARRCEAARGVGRPCLAFVSRFGCDGFISQAITLGSMVLSQQVHSPLASFSHRRLTCRNFAFYASLGPRACRWFNALFHLACGRVDRCWQC